MILHAIYSLDHDGHRPLDHNIEQYHKFKYCMNNVRCTVKCMLSIPTYKL